MSNISVTLNFGLSNSVTRSFASGTTLGQVLQDPNIQAVLGFPQNVVGKIDGSIQDQAHRLVDGDEVDIEVKANTKADETQTEGNQETLQASPESNGSEQPAAESEATTVEAPAQS